MNKKAIFLNLLLAGIPALTFAQTPVTPKTGNDKDKHGCIASAGYNFSLIKNDCIRLFEQEIRLKETNLTSTFTSQAVVIFNVNRKKGQPRLEEGEFILFPSKWRCHEKEAKKFSLLGLKHQRNFLET